MQLSVLVIDDEKNIRDILKDIIEDEGHTVSVADSIASAKELIKKTEFDIIFLDIWLPDGDGVSLIDFIKKNQQDAKIVMISGHANIPIAVKSLKEGAYDFLEKPFGTENILNILEEVKKEILEKRNYQLIKEKEEEKIQIIGNSPKIIELKNQIEKVANSNAWVIIFGENGSGKELVAKSIHYKSPRRNAPFVDINCAAIPDDLIESELFGYEKGAFTNAFTRKLGKIELADGGTLFLDEVADMSLPAQAKLLRVLEEREFTRIGGTQKIKVDIRVISATNKNLEEEIRKGNFRQDLAFRLSVIPIYVPPLRERGEDILVLADYFLDKFSKENKVKPPYLSDSVKNIFLEYKWPGNIRELKNLMERLVILYPEQKITPKEIPEYMYKKDTFQKEEDNIKLMPLKEAREEAEKKVIKKALEIYGNNYREISKILEVDLSSLYRKIKQYNLED
ncbi:sigma-54 dependent transcriptional regulator [Venenivibrio stagnispumantis]|uniref:DNA-binding transcriptional response regulator, NtrC family, contains REC, AAA-type ATPase, and a Fis-type DNA-binding domains n=1 Tax=Venenivibrio stagnispumantis TaxID=407998 RepID=A0AA46AFY6_9AQUI|nr:sigma-54 dependent transcriptional regulator [Venenivibrio stagnispumantis]MCW4572710.1 sigma-54 dependent transcriptional regulator [Venenivibrio stagnispumantis]SMP22805.1 DNA-binding transcriptional response regulator, NtrC family, contains REC, AAA-type ATPase, and a Fis-type DNA-binding domains [Venenivibrio stagnispumantis]